MALLDSESFDGYGTNLDLPGDRHFLWTKGGASYITGRSGSGRAMQMSSTSELQMNEGVNAPTLFVQFGFKPVTASQIDLYLLFKDGATFQASCQFDSTDGKFRFRRGVFPGGSLLATSSTILSLNTWYHIGIMYTFHSSAGALKMWINGALEINLSGLNTQQSGNNYASVVDFFPTGGGSYGLDDVIVLDDTGAAPRNTFLGDARVDPKFPNGAGTYSDWAVTGAANGQSATNETPPDDNTSYIADNTSGHKSTFAVEDVAAGSTILGCLHVMRAEKDDTGSATFESYVKSGGSERAGAVQAPSAGTYKYVKEVVAQDPAGGEWTPTSFNASEWGVKVP